MKNDSISFLSFPLFLKWYVTGKCNIRCKHCYLTDYTYYAPTRKMIEFAQYFLERGIRQFYFLGGEPLIRNDLEELICVLRQSKKKIGLRIATNGVLATQKRAKSLRDSGANDFQVSLEGATQKSHNAIRGSGTFEQAISGIQALREVGAHVTISLTIGHHNLYEIEPIIELTKKLNVSELKLAIFVPIGTGADFKDMILRKDDVLYARDTIKKARDAHPNLKIVSDLDVPCSKENGCGPCFGCGAGTTTLVLNPDFSVSACDLLFEEDRVALPTKSPHEIDEVWKKGYFFQKWRGCAPENSTKSIKDFENVHQNGCHIVNSLYGADLGIYKF